MPQELRAYTQWVAWKPKPAKPGKKPSKLPINPHTGRAASTTNASSWGTIDEAVARAKQDDLAGVGFVFTAEDEYVGVDLDECRNPDTGEIAEWARALITKLDTYTEVSPSGKGVHCIARGTLPAGGRKRDKFEIYDNGRFFTVTGAVLPGTPSTVEERSSQIAEVHAEVFGNTSTPAPAVSNSSYEPDKDDSLIEVLRSLPREGALWAGDHSGYPSQSEADLALCGQLAVWTAGDPAAIDRIFRRSGLMREKWDERRGESTYGERTIRKALDARTRIFKNSKRVAPPRGWSGGHGSEAPGKRPNTDTGNAERFVDQFGADFRYCHPWKGWLHWDGRRWAADQVGAAMGSCKEMVRGIYAEAANADDSAVRDAIASWATKSEKVDRRRAALELARSEKGIPILPDDLDQHPYLFNARNGTLDLATGRFREARREDLLTKVCPTKYVPDAVCPLWLSVLNRVLPDPEHQQYLQRLCGYSLTGDVGEQQITIALGDGANGKSTVFRTIQEVMGGGYAIQMARDLLIAKNQRSHPTEVADLFGIRLALGIETASTDEFDEAFVKMLTGGDRIRARRMRENFWEFAPTHKIVLITNHAPRIRGRDHAIYRRLHELRFDVRIPKSERDPKLLQKLLKEREGILAWMVQGHAAWKERGLDPPEDILRRQTEVVDDLDVAGQFIDSFVDRRPGARARSMDVYTAFVEWCADRELCPVSQEQFNAGMGSRGFGKRKSSGVMVFVDAVLSQPDEAVQGGLGREGRGGDVERHPSPHEAVNAEPRPSSPRPPSIGIGDPRKGASEQHRSCRACGHSRFWRLTSGGQAVCGICHPPIVPVGDFEWLDDGVPS